MTDIKDDTQDASMGDRIPNLMKIGEIPTEYGQTLSTDIIDATTFNQERCRFTLQRVSGFLHSNSKITLAITPLTNGGATPSYYPVNVGISQLIKSAQLTIGNKVVCAVDDYASFHAYQSLFDTNENNKEREQYLSQRLMNNAPVYEARSVADVADKPVNSASRIGLDNGKNPIVNVVSGVQQFQLLPFQRHDATSAETVSEAPTYSVVLSDLFPFLAQNQIPAFAIDEEIHVDLTFQDTLSSLAGASNSRRMCVAGAGTSAVEYQINRNEVKMIYDSIVYDGEIMAAYLKQNPKLSFEYKDYRLAKRTGDQTAFSKLVFNVGGNGRLVSKIIMGLQKNADYVSRGLLLGDAVSKSGGSGTELKINMRYNDRFEFSVDRDNRALHFHTTQQAEGRVPMVSSEQYAANPINSLTTSTFEGHAQNNGDSGLAACFNWTAMKPNRGERINNKGIELHYDATLAAATYTLRVYVELQKVATIENGIFDCYFA
tara:strand:- start:250 stop:1713 length:1464 start_codon:yes stop_codon:yes gene_type:complete